MMLSRRSLIGTTLAVGVCPRGALARDLSRPSISGLYRHALVINGNLSGPFYGAKRLEASDAAQIRMSGVSAIKTTLGGDSFDRAKTVAQIATADRTIAANGDLLMKIRQREDLVEAKRTGKLGIIYSFEGASMLEGRVDAIDAFRANDVLVMGLSYNLQSPFGSGTLVKNPTGLTDLGRQAVQRMNALGIAIDISHSDEPTSFAAISASTRPVLVTHAGCSALRPHPRNKSDALIRTLADRGGVFGIYELNFLAPGVQQATLDMFIAHLVHALKVAGEDHVSIGSDAGIQRFDMSPTSVKEYDEDTARRQRIGVAAPDEGPLPFVKGLNRPDRMEVIAERLAGKGYRSGTIEKVLGANLARVFGETWSLPRSYGPS